MTIAQINVTKEDAEEESELTHKCKHHDNQQKFGETLHTCLDCKTDTVSFVFNFEKLVNLRLVHIYQNKLN